MLYLFPWLVTLLRLAVVTPAPSHPDPRLELTAVGTAAREAAADVLVDADDVADLVLLDRAAVFDVDLAGERHELRLELDADGGVVGAALWWTGPATGEGRYDLSLALPALAGSATLDALTLEDDVVVLEAGGVRVPLGEDHVDPDVEPAWDAEGC